MVRRACWWFLICVACPGIAVGVLAVWWLRWWWAIGVGLAVAILLVALWAIWWWLPKQEGGKPLVGR
jgi:hypothetical protein